MIIPWRRAPTSASTSPMIPYFEEELPRAPLVERSVRSCRGEQVSIGAYVSVCSGSVSGDVEV